MSFILGDLYDFHFQVRAVYEAARLQNGNLVVLTGNVNRLRINRRIMEAAKRMLQGDSIEVDDLSEMNAYVTYLPGSVKAKIQLFSELREQNEPEHSAELASRYLDNGATVLAVVHGVSADSIERRLLNLGFSRQHIPSRLTIVSCPK